MTRDSEMLATCVLISCYQNQSGLLRTARSLTRDTSSFDVVIIDDGSDPPLEVPEGACGHHQFFLHRIHKNVGLSHALNAGLAIVCARGYRYIARLDSGDLIAPGRIAKQVEYLEAHPRCGVVGSYIAFVSPEDCSTVLFWHTAAHTPARLRRALHLRNVLIHSGVMFRTEALNEVGHYLARGSCSEDYEIFLRISTKYELGMIPELLTLVEHGLSGISVTRRRVQQRERLRLQLRYFDPRLWESWIGVLRTIAALVSPAELVWALKHWTSRNQETLARRTGDAARTQSGA